MVEGGFLMLSGDLLLASYSKEGRRFATFFFAERLLFLGS